MHRSISRFITQLIAVMLSTLFFTSSAGFKMHSESTDENAPIIIVLSSESKPYQVAAQACSKSLTQTGHKTRIMLLNTLSDQDFLSMTGSVITIGARASQSALNNLPRSTMLYYCMVQSPDTIGLTRRSNTSGISSDADPAEEIRLINLASSSIRKIGMFYNSESESSKKRLQRATDSLPKSMQIIAVDLSKHSSVSVAIKDLFDSDIDLVWTIPDPAVYNSAVVKTLLIESIRHRVPVFGFSHSIVRAGSAFGIGIEPKHQGARLAELIESNSTNKHLTPNLSVAINSTVASRINFKLSDALIKKAEVTFGSE